MTVPYRIIPSGSHGAFPGSISGDSSPLFEAGGSPQKKTRKAIRSLLPPPTNPYSSSFPDVHFFPQTIYQPTLDVNFTGTNGSCTVQAMGWGYDVWAYDWVD